MAFIKRYELVFLSCDTQYDYTMQFHQLFPPVATVTAAAPAIMLTLQTRKRKLHREVGAYRKKAIISQLFLAGLLLLTSHSAPRRVPGLEQEFRKTIDL